MKKFLFLITVILFSSCSNEIDRSQAEQLLKKEIGYPYLEYNQAKWDIWYFQDKGKYVVSNPKGRGTMNLKSLVDNGLIDLSNGSRKVGFFSRQRTKNTYRYSLSKKSKDVLWNSNSLQTSFNYWLADLPMYEIDLNEVTGIKFEDDKKTKATIEFTEKKTKTSPFTALSRNANRQDLVTRTAKAELYDDGWRITFNGLPNKIKIKSLEKVSGWGSLFENKKSEKQIQQDRIDENQGGPEDIIGVINDPDGYTNLRKDKNSSSKIIEKVLENKRFLIMSQTGDWWYVNVLESGNQGYIHKSRIKIVE